MISLAPIRGMHDTLPEKLVKQQYILNKIIQVLDQFGCQPIQLPLIETTALFKRSVGITSDIVQKEMYTFTDQNEESLALRPEGTAGCYRAYLNHFQRAAPYQKLWYYGPMYRRERPQKGRQREFYQLGVEFFGYDSITADIELISLIHRIFSVLGIDNKVVCKLNYLPSTEARAAYTEALKTFFAPMLADFDEVHRLRFENNPLRLLDSKDAKIIAMLDKAPLLSSFLAPDEQVLYTQAIKELEHLGIPICIDERMVRGLDYYSGIIFEWQTETGLGAQNTVCAGGRTDALGMLLANKPCHSLGMAIGIERLMMLMSDIQTGHEASIFIFPEDVSATTRLSSTQAKLHQHNLNTFVHHNISQAKKQLGRAEKMNCCWALGVTEHHYVLYDLINQTTKQLESLDELVGVTHER